MAGLSPSEVTMPLWDKVKQELDRAGRVAQDALDEGRIRLDAFRVRQQADKAAQALGYAAFRAHQGGRTLDPAELDRLAATLATHESEATRLEAQLEALRAQHASDGAPGDGAHTEPSGAAGATPQSGPTGATSAGGSTAAQAPPAGTATPPHGDPLANQVPREPGGWHDPLR
jgi:hypothetical protein